MPTLAPSSHQTLASRSTAGNPVDLEAFARAGGVVHVVDGDRQPEARATSTALDLAQWATNRSVTGWGLTDAEATPPRRARQANVGLFSELLRIRAQNVARAVVGVRGPGFAVQRLQGQNEWADVEAAHPWVRLLARPNAERHPLQVWTWASLCRDLTGRAAFVVEDDARGVPVGLWEIFPEFGELYPVPSARGGLDGWVFLRADGERVELAARDVVVWEHADPTSPYRTASLLQRAAFNLDKGLYADVYERDQLRDARRPPVYLSSDQDLTPTQATEYGTRFKQTYLRAGRDVKGVPVFGKGMGMHPFALNAVDLALIESLSANDERLFWLAGVPQGLYDKTANRANTYGARRIFSELTLQPMADGLAGSLTIGFERAFRLRDVGTEGTIEVRSPDLSPADPMEEARVDEIELRSGTATVNEVRARMGRPNVDGGDVPLVSGALRPLSIAAAPPPPPPQLVPPADGEDDDEAEGDDDEEEAPDPSATDPPEEARALTLLRIAGVARRAGADLDDDAHQAEWAGVAEVRDAAVVGLEAAALDAVRWMAEAAAEGVRENLPLIRAAWTRRDGGGEALADLAFRLDEWLVEWDARLGPFVMEILAEGYRTGALRIGADLSWDAARPGVQTILRESLDQAASVPETVRGEVASALAEGLAEGEGRDELAERVRGHVEGIAPWKAREVAQTTGGGAFTAGELEGFRDGGVTHKRWLSERDADVRASHEGVDDGEDVPIDEPFANGLMYPRDPAGPASEVVNCRCDVLPSTPTAVSRSWRDERDERIRSDYPAMRDASSAVVAMNDLAEREGLSYDQVRKIIYRKNRQG